MRRLWPLVAVVVVTGCVARPDPDPAVMSSAAPPWEAPRDAVSYIEAAGFAELPLDTDQDPYSVDVDVLVDGVAVDLPAYIGVDRLRAVQAPVHTHDATGDVWLEGEGNRQATLGQLFTLWGVKFDAQCLGAACGGVVVTADGEPVSDPVGLVLRDHESITVSAVSE
ncbi:MAG: hypothetical protein ACK5KO_00975 [Arachnia sp.]